MNTTLTILLVGLVSLLVLPILISYVAEALRSTPAMPTQLSWAPEIAIRNVRVNGLNLRYVTAGHGQPLVLLHTLRTQLDMYQKVIPKLSRHFQVYALDYPGHGFSDIPDVEYTADFFTKSVGDFLEQLNIENAILVGESIGGNISLLLAARHNPRVQRVIAVNAYDYDAGRGITRSSVIANVIFSLNNVPLIGSTVMRMRNYDVFQKVVEGAVSHTDALPPALVREMYEVGNRPHHYRAQMSLVGHWAGWEQARPEYAKIDVPVLLVYGEHDWSRPEEREANQRAIPGAETTIVKDARHFLSLDAPDRIIELILDFSHAKADGVRYPRQDSNL